MAEELSINFSAEYADSVGVEGDVEIANLLVTLVTAKLMKTVVTIATSETALELGDISTRGTCILVNRDPTNYVEVKTGTSGTIFAKLFPQRASASTAVAGLNFCVLHLGSGAQSPYLIANSGSCKVEVFLNPL